MEILEYWKIMRKRLWLIMALMLLTTAGTVYYVQRQVPLYRTTTTLFINPSAPSAMVPYLTALSVQSLANTYSELMRTRSFAELVGKELEFEIATDSIIDALSTRYVGDTQIFRILATHANPEVAQAIANRAASVLIAENATRQRREQEVLEAQRDPQKILERQRLAELQSTLQEEVNYYSEQVQNIERQIAELQSGLRSQETDQRLQELRVQLIDNRSSRVSVLSSMAQAQATLANSSSDVSAVNRDTAVVIDEAPLPGEPLASSVNGYVLVALLAALGIGVALAFFLEYLDYTVKTPEDLDRVYQIPTQGAIGYTAGKNGRSYKERPLITMTDPRSPIAEAFRSLRTSIRMGGLGRPVRALLVTSAGPGEGKTFVSANLAVSMAHEGKHVILVDADLRRPQLHKVFDIRREPGLSDLVVDDTLRIELLLQSTGVENLSVLTCGTIPPNPAELLGSARAAEVMHQLRQQCDIVIFDSPPAATVTDAVVIAPRMDAVLQVVLASVTRIDLIRRCKILLERTDARIMGPILNQVQVSDLGYYYNYYYYGGYYHHDSEQRGRSGWRRLLPAGRGRSRQDRSHVAEVGATNGRQANRAEEEV